ncbi:MAG: cytochrome c3 family protein [Nitrospirae bacterium]|nr:cytochrome c3 family protein [Nitrospirota bacterium]
MRCKKNLRYLISAVILSIVVIIAASCSQLGLKENAAGIEAPPEQTEAAPSAEPAVVETTPAPETAAAPAPAPPPVELAQQTPAVKSTAPASGQKIPAQYKNIDPSLLIYLSSRGVIAGTGDPSAVAGDAEKMGQMEHPAAMELARLPKDQYGLVNWAAAIKNGNIKPLDSLEPGAMAAPPFNLDIVIQTKSKFMADVVYPHYVHTLWLGCTNCHTSIFQMKAGGNPEMTMAKIAAGEYCGRCHNRVAFPLTDCSRCHVKPKETAKTGR